MKKRIEVIWRQITTKSFTDLDKAKKLVKKLKSDADAEEIEVFEVEGEDTTKAWFDIDNFKRYEMDG